MPKRKAPPVTQLGNEGFVLNDAIVQLAESVRRFKDRFGHLPEAIILPVEIEGVPVMVAETAHNGVYVGPVPA